jgi:hypothetical protein
MWMSFSISTTNFINQKVPKISNFSYAGSRRKEQMKREEQVVLILIILIANLTLIVGLAQFGTEVDVQIDKDSVFYMVNEKGDLTIQVQGILLDLELTETQFNLSIPNDFEVGKLENNSPIVKVANEGRPKDKYKLDEDNFQSNFVVETYASTPLPIEYHLTIITTEKTFTNTIIPKWPSQPQLSGSGASIMVQGPYITSLYAYDGYKGNNIHIRTYIYNPLPYEKTVEGLKYKTSSDTYNDWTDEWTGDYSEYGYIDPYQTWVVHDYINYFFQAPSSSKRFAFNSGTFHITEVFADGSGMGGYWSDYFTPSTSYGEFDVNVQSGTHPVFVVHLRDSYFTSEFGSGDFLNIVENHEFTHPPPPYPIGGTSDTKTYFKIDFHSLLLSWTPTQYDLQYLYWNQVRQNAKTELGLTVNWRGSIGAKGTEDDNHGFDLLIGSSGKHNIMDDGEEYLSCKASVWSNYIVTMDGWYDPYFWPWPISVTYNDDQMQRATLHEIFHTYNAGHQGIGFIMEHNIIFGNWYLHEDTKDMVNSKISHFDGPP